MADLSKAEKIASARKKLKQFQQKNKESNNNRSTSSSLKSNSPVDLVFKEQSVVPNNLYSEEENNRGTESSNVSESTLEPRGNGLKHEVTSFFKYQNNNSNNYDSFFDNVSQSGINTKGKPDVAFNDNSKVLQYNTDKGNITIDTLPATNEQESTQTLAEIEKLLAIEKSSNTDLQKKLSESHNHILSLQSEIRRLNENQNLRVSEEIKRLEEKINLQLQTIEILVSEKSELQKEIIHLQDDNKANHSRCEELASRLKASRSQVQKLEKELQDDSENRTQHNSILKKLEVDTQQKDVKIQELIQSLSDAKNEIKELNKRIELESLSQHALRKDLEEREKQYAMAQIKLTQLGSENESDVFIEVERLKKDLVNSQSTIERIQEEGQKCEAELRQYISNLNAQVLQANAKCERAERDKEEAAIRIDSLIKHVSDLEKQLQQEKAQRESLEETEVVRSLKQELEKQEQELTNKDEELNILLKELNELKEKLSEAEIWKENVPDMGLLQQAMESDRVAAARAIEQNNSLKQKQQELEEYIIRLNNSKLELTEELDKYKHMAGDYRLQMEKYKSRQEMRMVDSVTQTVNSQKSDSVSQTTYHDIAPLADPHEPVSVETMIMIENKLKRTMDRVAELSEDKHRLEHLVLQLQSETETIGEYVTLYQNQRSLLKEKAEEKERQMALIAKEREELRAKLNEINELLTRFPHNPEVENTTCKISSLVGEIQSSSIVQEKPGPPPTFHPCLLCSGKLINV